MNLNFKIISALFAGIFAVGMLIYFNSFTKNYFERNNDIVKIINSLEREEIKLDYEVLKSSVFLYTNFDIIAKTEDKLFSLINKIKDHPHFTKDHQKSYKQLILYEESLNKKIEAINDFETLNASIKNSSMYLTTLLNRSFSVFNSADPKQREYLNRTVSVISSIFLAKNSFDSDFLKNIEDHLFYMKSIDFVSAKQREFNNLLQAHLRLFLNYFPKYKELLDTIMQSESKKILDNLEKTFIKTANDELKVVTLFSTFLILLFISSIGVIIYFLYLTEKENIRLKRLQKDLQKLATTDALTGLKNRFILEKDKLKIKNPVFMIVNIDKFKHYNDFYGIKAGDYVLKEVAKRIKETVPSTLNAGFYRIGGDDFGILFENSSNIDIESLAKNIIDYFRTDKIVYQNIDMHISVSIGITTQKPLIEKADMALKYVKKDHKSDYAIYDDNFGFYEKIEENLEKTKILKEAIEKDKIVPCFQPIIDNKTGDVVKFEALGRIESDENELVTVYDFLDIAKEAKLYELITHSMLIKCFEKFAVHKYEFSVNLSMEDLTNKRTMDLLKNLLNTHPETAKRVTFELLEAEAITDYDVLKDFTALVKSKGAKVAIDDFGSGYSNFEHILNIDIDYIKIDGSLIKNLDKNKNAKLIVETVVAFAKKAGIKTVAEYVHSGEIAKIVKEMGIDYSQGYIYSKPEKNLQC
ncbi:EAL domain-containing protein [Nitrosophilus alvini]|uniref:EAL domain-containing protein n=1 Tax=Nitrosophilus alvini TaxID=2714855 RepID=UPI00190C4C76|nr:EAL domain-containing protein [Nitrosophilus alvini]